MPAMEGTFTMQPERRCNITFAGECIAGDGEDFCGTTADTLGRSCDDG
jgi:hypothetical protein